MHVSSYRYGSVCDWSNSGAMSSEVRISYFDPITGEPCDEKPEPRPKPPTEAKPTDKGIRKQRMNHAEHKRKRGGQPRPVMVDGVRYESVAIAANRIGTNACYLSDALSKGKNTVKGRKVEFA